MREERNLSVAWGLERARATAADLLRQTDGTAARLSLLRSLGSRNPEVRKRAADVARRISDRDASFLQPVAAQLADLLAETPLSESRTRWHLGLVVARSAVTPDEVATAAELLWRLSEDASTVVRCSAIEGLGLLARGSSALRAHCEPYLAEMMRSGTAAMQCRARQALAKLERISR